MADSKRLGARIRQLRKQEGLTQAVLAERLGISASYLNLIENNHRALTAALLIRVSELFDVDVRSFVAEGDDKAVADLQEVFGDPLFEGHACAPGDLEDVAGRHPELARAILHLYRSYRDVRARQRGLTDLMLDQRDTGGIDQVRLSSEQVSDLIQRERNYFPALEEAAERLSRDARLRDEELFSGLAAFLERRHKVRVRIENVSVMHGALRRFDAERRELLLSEVLRRGSRNFQLAHQVALLELPDLLDRLASGRELTTPESRALARVALANYCASAVLMPYDDMLRAARDVRYDLDLLGHRFRASFEQVCHRLTTLRRRGDEGVPFYMVRVDIAGNLSKRFSATTVRFPRFSGLCPLWNVHAAFLQPGFIRTQIARFPDGSTFFSIARTVRKHRGGYRAQNIVDAIGLGCDIEHAGQLVYADGVDLKNRDAAVPVGTSCRLCERLDCEARAFPSVHELLHIDENVRGVSFYAPIV